MTPALLWRLAAIAFALIGASAFAPAAVPAPQQSQLERQILVMLRMPPDHFRPSGSYSGGYGDAMARAARDRMARAIAKKYGLALVDDWPMPMIGVDCFVMAVPDGRSTSAAAEQVSRDSDVSWAEPVALYTSRGAAAPENDPLYAAEPAAAKWHLAELHRMASGRGARVAVIDSGIDAAHPDLAGQVTVNRNFVSGQQLVAEQHGTAVAGIIAAKTDNRIGISGVAPGAKLLGLRACWQERGPAAATVCDTLSLAKALYFAVQNRAEILNLSLSGPDDRLLRMLVAMALKNGQTVVAAFDAARPDGGFPASMPGVIRVSDSPAIGSRGRVYVAPGRDIPTTEPGGRWFLVNGSSFAAAHVSGLVALMRERGRSSPLAFVAERPGGGSIDACATLIKVAATCDCPCGTGRFARGAGRR